MNPRYDRHITSPEWYALKDRIRARALGRCEWCRLRPMALLHHRSYAHVGAEPEADVSDPMPKGRGFATRWAGQPATSTGD